MPRITLIKLLEYREWTETLGYDREWKIQELQSNIYSSLQRMFSRRGGFVIPVRYDYFIALSNGFKEKDLEEILTDIEPLSPKGVRIVSLVHKRPFTAQLMASRIAEKEDEKLVYISGEEDPLAVVHIDFNNITRTTIQTSVFETYVKIMSVYSEITRATIRLGGITGYLGGDNMIAVLSIDAINDLLELLPTYLKAGVGVSLNSRKALELSAKALSDIRTNRRRRFLILYDNELQV